MIRVLPDALGRTRELVEPELRSVTGRLVPEVRRIASYHFGWTDPEGRPTGSVGGKGLRPTLALLCAEGAGGAAQDALPGAVAVELVHNFSLLHDDVMDHDTERRHRPTAWSVFGVGEAIVAGDALLVLALELLVEDPRPERVRAASMLARATTAMIAGQGQDLAFESRSDVALADCLRMSGRKTGALISCACSVGAVLARAPEAVVSALGRYGSHLGLAFQAVDDLLGVWGDPERTGKPAFSDLRQGKKTIPVVAALEAADADGRLRALLDGGRPLREPDLLAAAELLEACGARERTIQRAEDELEAALGCLDEVGLAGGPRRGLEEIARFVVSRER